MGRELSGCAYRKLEKKNKVVKNNMKLDDMFQMKCATIQEVQDFNETLEPIDGDVTDKSSVQLSIEEIQKENTNAWLESQVNKEVSILQPLSSSDKPDADPALWILNEVTRYFICKNGFHQNLDGHFSHSKRQYQYIRRGTFRPHYRYLSKDMLKTTLINGKPCQRDYLSYSTGNILIKLINTKIQQSIKPVHLR
ncbi:uncharacterized protein LOC132947607 [Metopolophium dirhodum]|uniref:uncharacterized protein LOC132947607 n=1 Tax=Metopolophium dirhodum TaxID=44670 RepID=UPI0029901521|nr:uncharacterized protein LOC132947607 [Metopolophium dirhodum]